MTLVLLALGCGPKSDLPRYDNGLLELAAGFAAKEACSCVFVSERPIDVCRDWVRVSPPVARFKVDTRDHEVRATALGMKKTVALWVEDVGCVIVTPPP